MKIEVIDRFDTITPFYNSDEVNRSFSDFLSKIEDEEVGIMYSTPYGAGFDKALLVDNNTLVPYTLYFHLTHEELDTSKEITISFEPVKLTALEDYKKAVIERVKKIENRLRHEIEILKQQIDNTQSMTFTFLE